MDRTLRSLFRMGLGLLEQRDRATEPVGDLLRETADLLRRRIRGEDRTLRYVLTFAAGLGVGVGVGLLTAPVSGAESRSTIAGKVHDIAKRINNQSAVEGEFATGTQS
jgi:hypothetical protein